MKQARVIALAAMLCGAALPALAGVSVSVRLVKASNSGTQVDPSLADVVSAFQKNLAFKSYALEASGSFTFPADATLRLGPYKVRCSGPQNRLSILVHHGRSPMINTTTTLKTGKPLVLGGFPARDGRYILVFIAK